MALFYECMLKCARKLLDTADIVRDAIYRHLFLTKAQNHRGRHSTPFAETASMNSRDSSSPASFHSKITCRRPQFRQLVQGARLGSFLQFAVGFVVNYKHSATIPCGKGIYRQIDDHPLVQRIPQPLSCLWRLLLDAQGNTGQSGGQTVEQNLYFNPMSRATTRQANPTTGQASGDRSPTKTTGTPTADASGRGSSDRLGDGSVSRRPASLCRRQPGGQLYRDDPVRAQQRQKAATRKVEQRRKFAAPLFVDGSDAACRGQGPRTETLLSAQAGAERDGQGAGGDGAQAGHSVVDHAAG